MIPLLKADLRRLLTVRSTYVLLSIAAAFVTFICFWVTGHNAHMGDPAVLITALDHGASVIVIFMSLIAILLITHEYRYNTILYTFTAANSRSKVLLSKVLVVLGFTFAATLCFMAWGVGMAWLGAQTAGIHLAAQEFPLWDHLWRTMFVTSSWVLFGLLFGVLFRHIVGAIVTLLIFPSTIEPLLGMVLKDNIKYLPFHALEQVIAHVPSGLTTGSAALLVGLYLAGGWAVAWWLFCERDAN